MKLAVNNFIAALRKRTKQLGLWLSLSSNYSAEVIAPSGFDWVLIDMEHSPNDLSSVLAQLQVFQSYPLAAVVRPPSNDPVMVKRLLDIGAQALLFPMIQNVAEARLAVSSCRYPPRGIRGVAGSSRATRFGRVSDYIERVEDETAVILQLETVAALQNAEQIAAVDGVTAVFFGPADIAADLGVIGQPMSNVVWDEILPVANRLIEKGIPVGTLVLDAEFAAKLLNDGFSFVACGADTALLAAASDQLLEKVKAKLE